jgi:hypothetical protein
MSDNKKVSDFFVFVFLISFSDIQIFNFDIESKKIKVITIKKRLATTTDRYPYMDISYFKNSELKNKPTIILVNRVANAFFLLAISFFEKVNSIFYLLYHKQKPTKVDRRQNTVRLLILPNIHLPL